MSENNGFQPPEPPRYPADPTPEQPTPGQPGGQPPVGDQPQFAGQQYPGQPQYQQPYGGQFPPSAPGKGLGITALVLGIVAFVLAFLPIINFVSYPLAIAAIILGIIGFAKKGASKVMPIVGGVLGVLALIIAIIVTVIGIAFVNNIKSNVDDQYSSAASKISSAASEASSAAAQYSNDSAKVHTVKYVATSNVAAKADFSNETGTSNEAVSGTWEKEVTMKGSFLFPTVSVSVDDFSTQSNLSCEIFIDGQSISKKTGSILVICSGNLK
ncbi:hypothetical protein RSal33209_3329 [Renibacterium salmoninarum ATCC 33209]|uniref:DUF4190 domain-containing protein n=1 Tax=Renibacterium salmoninarum (strain ATCC 33209 / DSM 20767 / JCM 11484 / NBRC 15589 / NCIMB 2235) TaxID=288705 RepID=A9WV20_RENSM|nr:hypothetical protein [Renibacterium salmoninarum]ABY25041.1 hypothetical protein RSal33209_3329 [Renibacterium salmoninarum ATCC 33209]